MNKHKLADSIARSIAALVSLVATHYAAATTYYVDPVGGLDTNPGTIAAPVKTITKGGVLAGPGDTVNLRGGIYNNPAVLGRNCVFDNTYSGTSGNVIIVQSYPGELAIFDPGYPEFMSNPNTAWVPCTEPGALSDEYISANTYNMAGNDGAWGCFLNANKTAGDRLLTYTNVEDLRATNESFVLVSVSDPRPGRPVWTDTTKKYLWTYRGPGVWWDPATQKIHFRAAPTHFNQPGIADYSGGSDPRSMSLSISLKGHEALNVYQADYLVLKNLVFQNGGNRTAEIGGSSTSNYAEHVTFDHCGFYSSRNGTTTTLTRFLRFQHCVFDGCLPSYVCRSDVKDSFDYVKPDGTKGSDGCSRMTQAALLCAGQNEDKEIANCEFRNGHDGIQLNGETRPRLHDSLIENCNDEAIMFYGAYPCVDIRIYNNVIRSCMQAFSSSVGAVVPPMPSGARYIYRNIIDMRVPSLGYRQLSPDPVLLWRFGEDFKYNDLIPEIYCYQNTFVLADMDGNDCVTFWTNVLDTAQAPRKLMNNIMMILQTDKPIYSIPKVYSGNPHLSDGNLWCRRKAVLDSVLFSSFYTGTSYDTWSDFRNSALWTS
ncbi:MAG TPA: right-handed parallel beta-helix repeat-containing protein, partial [Roseimicrobium sp.]|nr:right-handed parallel beta-helix repeat-containing protein [Roseimicrobium sp.]